MATIATATAGRARCGDISGRHGAQIKSGPGQNPSNVEVRVHVHHPMDLAAVVTATVHFHHPDKGAVVLEMTRNVGSGARHRPVSGKDSP